MAKGKAAQVAAAFDIGATAAPQATLQRLVALGHEALEAEQAVAQLEEALGVASKRMNELRMKILPDLMAEVGLDEFKLPNGAKVAIREFVQGSLPKEPDARKKALKLLDTYEAGGLVKTEISMAFGRGSDNVVKDVVATLREKNIEFEQDQGVHAATLQSFARERLRNGETVDLEALGLFAGRTAKITLPKEKQAKQEIRKAGDKK